MIRLEVFYTVRCPDCGDVITYTEDGSYVYCGICGKTIGNVREVEVIEHKEIME